MQNRALRALGAQIDEISRSAVGLLHGGAAGGGEGIRSRRGSKWVI